MQEGVERGQNTKLNGGRGNSRFWAGPGRTFWALSAFQGQRPLFWAPTHLQTTAGQGVGVGGNESKVQVRLRGLEGVQDEASLTREVET